MTDETKARLREIALANKGRKNLKGLDRTLGLIAFDYVLDQEGGSTLPPFRLSFKGTLSYINGPDLEHPVTDRFGWPYRIACYRTDRERARHHLWCKWVRLKHCQPWQVEEFANRWPSRKVAGKTYQGPNAASYWQTVTLHPLDVMIAWLRFLWPEEQEWAERARKYVVGFTDGYVHDHPGVGAKVELQTLSELPFHVLTDIPEGVVTKADDGRWFELTTSDGITRSVTLSTNGDAWTILD